MPNSAQCAHAAGKNGRGRAATRRCRWTNGAKRCKIGGRDPGRRTVPQELEAEARPGTTGVFAGVPVPGPSRVLADVTGCCTERIEHIGDTGAT